MSTSSISLKGAFSPADFARMLEDLAGSIKAGTVCLQKGGEFVTLKPASTLEFEIEASARKGRQKLELRVKWQEPVEAAPEAPFTISSQEPEPAPEAGPEPAPEAGAGAAPCPVEGEAAAPEMAGGALAMDDTPEAKPAKRPKKK